MKFCAFEVRTGLKATVRICKNFENARLLRWSNQAEDVSSRQFIFPCAFPLPPCPKQARKAPESKRALKLLLKALS